MVHGWTDEWVEYLDYIFEIDTSHDAPYRQRLRYEITIYMRGVDSNKQAGPLRQRPDYKSSAKSRQNNTLDPAVQQHLEWLSFNWPTYFSACSSSNIGRKPNVVEFFILGPSMARLALSSVARQRMVGSAITTTTPLFSNSTSIRRLVRKLRATRSQPLSNSPESSLHSLSCALLGFFVVSGSFASRQWQLP